MSYYPKGHQATDDEIDDFDEFDPTPYGGGYDIISTFGRSLPPSDDICYPIDQSDSNDFDYDRSYYDSATATSAYGNDALDNEYSSYSRPKPRNRPESGSGGRSENDYGDERYGRRRQEEEDRPYGYERPSYGRSEEEDYRRPRRSEEEEDYRRPRRSEDEEDYRRSRRSEDESDDGYRRKKYDGESGGDDDEDDNDEDEERRNRRRNRRRQNQRYDDDE